MDRPGREIESVHEIGPYSIARVTPSTTRIYRECVAPIRDGIIIRGSKSCVFRIDLPESGGGFALDTRVEADQREETGDCRNDEAGEPR